MWDIPNVIKNPLRACRLRREMQMKDHHHYRLGHRLQLSEFTHSGYSNNISCSRVYRQFCAAAITKLLTLSNVQWEYARESGFALAHNPSNAYPLARTSLNHNL
jgi:hypothetical protein